MLTNFELHVFTIYYFTQDFRTHVDQSCRYSEEFVNIYYDCMDKKRRVSFDPLFFDLACTRHVSASFCKKRIFFYAMFSELTDGTAIPFFIIFQ